MTARKDDIKVGDKYKGWIIEDIKLEIRSGSKHMIAYLISEDGLKTFKTPVSRIRTGKMGPPYRNWDYMIERNFKHGFSGTRIHKIWKHMKTRCYNTNDKDYKDYGGRGITICDDWKNDFIKFKDWAFSNGYLETLTIDRINVNGNYEPSNCRWSTLVEQMNNQRRSTKITLTAFGETKLLNYWARDERCMVSNSCLMGRWRKKWDHEKAITTPAKNKNRKNKS